jgi:hypothetical protein
MAQYERPGGTFDQNRPHPKRILLFDVDGTLTAARKKITPDMHRYFEELRKKVLMTHNSSAPVAALAAPSLADRCLCCRCLASLLLCRQQRVGIVGGSDLIKQIEQIGENGDTTAENTRASHLVCSHAFTYTSQPRSPSTSRLVIPFPPSLACLVSGG